MKKLKDLPAYILLRILVAIFWVMPFPVLHFLSSGLSFLMNHVVRYRRKVVERNLRRCFPDKSTAEIVRLRKAFYLHLCDILLEGLKGMAMSSESLRPRFKVLNPELVTDHLVTTSCIGVTAHYSNWEWATEIVGHYVSPNRMTCIYKPLQNSYINEFMRRRGATNNFFFYSLKETAVTFERETPLKVMFALIADQSPSNMKRAIWADFFGVNTPCLHGLEFYAREHNLPVIYIHIKRVRRGYYETTLTQLVDDPNALPEGEITQRYMSKLEAVLREDPTQWLWSHKRWKKIEN